MSTQNDGGPAFPQHGWTSNPEVLERMKNQGGMTLRDWFAGQILSGMAASQYWSENFQNMEAMLNDATRTAYAAADSAMKARAK